MQNHQSGMIILQKHGHRKSEPLDDTLSEKVFTLIEELAYSQEVSLSPEEIEQLLDMHGIFKAGNIKPFPDLSTKP